MWLVTHPAGAGTRRETDVRCVLRHRVISKTQRHYSDEKSNHRDSAHRHGAPCLCLSTISQALPYRLRLANEPTNRL